ncbi:succinate-semialdehyde dehydrogenase (NADP(+)) [Catenulispora sp. NF23]|uniref:succinic semialdehyde dehydrogenase n=1 Tax=Catenulispora pinistramenti TaxID=2705254 RepID=UPI001BAE0A0D|nr:succinic semialdehyde dehydrogenase [Catenulispora pinistramenti]MBS2536943.1 succinate-semialdehyde dehydrogenase (NADP(+)) [Catenulispora pinistramenti]
MGLPSTTPAELLTKLTGMVVSTSGRSHAVTEVYTGEQVVDLPQSDPVDVQTAYATARAAQAVWASWPLKRRLAVMKRFHELLLECGLTAVDLMQIETGKARRMAFEETCDVLMVTSHYIKAAPRILKERKHGGVVPIVSTSTEVRVPKGVVGLISPWNFPFATSLSDAMPALIAGNGIVLKPDNKSTLNVAYGVSLLYEAGLPTGLVQLVCGQGPDIGSAIIDNADYVMFTGSTATGRTIGAQAGQNLIGCTLELGGKNPLILLDDADLDEAIAGTVTATFLNTGQACMHIERIYVSEKRREEFTRRFVEAVRAIQVGGTYDFAPDMGSLVSVPQRERVQSHVEDALAKGATLLTGGKPRPDLGPAFFEPTVLTDVTEDMVLARTETFGPVVSIYGYASVEQAVALANDTEYGLNASVWGGDRKAAESVGRRIRAGNINVNDGLAVSYASKKSTSGGFKASGVGSRHGDAGMLKYTDVQNVAVLKKQVLTNPPDTDWAKQVAKTVKGLRFMRKLGIR